MYRKRDHEKGMWEERRIWCKEMTRRKGGGGGERGGGGRGRGDGGGNTMLDYSINFLRRHIPSDGGYKNVL